MTDLEIARRCAEAMGINLKMCPPGVWNPLTDAAQNQRVEWELLRRGVRIFLMEQALEIEWATSGKCMMKEYPCRTIEEKRRAVCMALCDVTGVGDG
jgi:hypothetical protein